MSKEQIMAYVLLVQKGKITLEQVPEAIRTQVQEIIQGEVV